MTSAETAAWVGAGAAIVQAFGAVGAIVAAVMLARGSAKREREAIAAADRRAEEAERRSEQRIAEAEHERARRETRERNEHHNGIVDHFLTLARACEDEWEADWQQTKAKLGDFNGSLQGRLGGATYFALIEEIEVLKSRASDVELIHALHQVQKTKNQLMYFGQGIAQFATNREASLKQWYQLVEAVRARRR